MKRHLKSVALLLLGIFIFINGVAMFHAYRFTHFTGDRVDRTKSPQQLSLTGKVKTLLFGVDNPRPANDSVPRRKYEVVTLSSNKRIECWSIRAEFSRGTVVLFHGYGGHKSALLDKAEEFLNLGYSTLLVDFMGSGGSEGSQTTIGFFEADQVRSSYQYLAAQGEDNIVLFGTSMGAVAILKAIGEYDLSPTAIIIECPYGTMYETVCARFRSMNVPTIPMAGLLVFWGGVENGFWAFGHNPVTYAKRVSCPALLLYGAMDEKVSRSEIDALFSNLNGRKVLEIYPEAGHENYLQRYRDVWVNDVRNFLTGTSTAHSRN